MKPFYLFASLVLIIGLLSFTSHHHRYLAGTWYSVNEANYSFTANKDHIFETIPGEDKPETYTYQISHNPCAKTEKTNTGDLYLVKTFVATKEVTCYKILTLTDSTLVYTLSEGKSVYSFKKK